MTAVADLGSRYYITSDGEIFTKSFKIQVINQTGKTSKFKHYKERELKGGVNNAGYRQVRVDKKLQCVHVLVAKSFIPNPNNLPEVNHIDGDKSNNKVENLEWCNRSYNIQHAYDIGLKTKTLGEDNHATKYTESVVTAIYLDATLKVMSQEKIGRKYGVPQITVSNIKTKKTWKHLTDLIDIGEYL